MKRREKTILGIEVSRSRDRDTGMAAALVFVLLAAWTGRMVYARAAAVVLILTMVWPRPFRPVSVAWFGFARALGFVVSNALLSVIFFVVVTPVGLVRRLMGRDPLMRRRFGAEDGSVFTGRDRLFGPDDIERPY